MMIPHLGSNTCAATSCMQQNAARNRYSEVDSDMMVEQSELPNSGKVMIRAIRAIRAENSPDSGYSDTVVRRVQYTGSIFKDAIPEN